MAQHSTDKHKAWKWVAVVYVIALHIFSAVLIVKADFAYKAKVKIGIVAATPDPHVSNMILYHQWMDETVPDKAIIFLGDSITQGLATAAVAPYTINYGIGSENTAQLLDAIPSYKSLARASAVVLAIGINDLIQGVKVGLDGRYKKLVEAIPHKIPLIWSAVMPAKSEGVALSDINRANQTIRILCENRGNCIFVDTWRVLADKNGQIIKYLFLDDGVHLSPEGYGVWISELKQAVQDVSHANVQSVMSPGAALSCSVAPGKEHDLCRSRLGEVRNG